MYISAFGGSVRKEFGVMVGVVAEIRDCSLPTLVTDKPV